MLLRPLFFTSFMIDDFLDDNDFFGGPTVISAVHARLSDALRHSAVIGGTHWDADPDAAPLDGPEPTFFFAPSQIEKRSAEWGARELEARLADAWTPFVERSRELLTVQHGHGPQATVDCFLELLDGRTPPAIAHVLHP